MAQECKIPISRMAIASLILFCFPFLFLALLWTLDICRIDTTQPATASILDTFANISLMLFVSSTCIGFFALVVIKRSNPPLRGKALAKSVVIISAFIGLVLFSVPYQGRIKPIAQRVICGTNLKGLATAITVYSNDNNDELPGESWCDLLIQDCDISPKWLICPASDLIEGECSYALNKYVLGTKLSELHPDTVLLFETKTCHKTANLEPIENRKGFKESSIMRDMFTGKEMVSLDYWNQVAGPEALSTANHRYKGCNVVFANGESKWIPFEQLSNLKWSTKEPGIHWAPETVPQKYSGNMVLYQTAWLIFPCMVIFSLFYLKKIQLWFCLLSVICYSVVGIITGHLFELAAYGFPAVLFGYKAGLVWGGIVGVVFAMALKYSMPEKECIQYSRYIGIVLGILCGLLVNLTLILFHNHFEGISFGLAGYGGLMVGAVIGKVLGNLYQYNVSLGEKKDRL